MEATQSPMLTLAARGAMTLALAALLLSVSLVAWPEVRHAQQQRLALHLVTKLEKTPDASIHATLRQVAALGDPAIEALVRATASSRADVALVARRIIEERLANWRIRADAEAEFRLAEPLGKLATALAAHVEELGPFGQQWATRVVLEIVDLAGRCPPDQAAPLLADCSRVLADVPAVGPRMLTLNHQSHEAHSPSIARALPAVRLPTLRPHPPQRTPPRLPTPTIHGAPAADDPQSVSPTDQEIVPPAQRTLASDWVPEWSGRLIAPGALSERPAAGGGVPATAVVGDLIDVPSPQDMLERVHALKREPTRELFSQLAGTDRFTAAAAREVLAARGFGAEELAIAMRLIAADAAERVQLIDDLKVLPARAARRWLRELLDDPDADVRLKALTALATTNDPGLISIARDLVIRDTDPRVTQLASQIVRQAR